MSKQLCPAEAIIVIIIVLAILAGIWYMIYGKERSATLVHEGVLAKATFLSRSWNVSDVWELAFEDGAVFLVRYHRAPKVLHVGRRYEVLRSAGGRLRLRAPPMAERAEGTESQRKHEP